MVDPTAEARTEAGLTGAAGATRTAAAFMEAVAVHGTPAVAAILTRAVRVEEAGTSSAAGAAVDSAAVDSQVHLPWLARAALDHLRAASTAVRHAHRTAIRLVHTVEATDAQATHTAATPTLPTVAVAMAEAPGLPTAIAATTELTRATTAQLVRAALMARAILLLGKVAHTEIRTETRTAIKGMRVAVTERLRIAAILE